MLLNLRETPDQKVYVSSDFHLNHDPKWPVPIWESRGFKSAKEMTDGIIDTTNSIVRPNDILLFLGDWCLNTTIEAFEETLARFKCQNIYALWGNHNNPHEKKVYAHLMRERNVNGELYPFRYKNMVYYGHYLEAVLNGHYTVLCHYPIYVWNEMAHGAWMLCGHSHNGCEFSQSTNVEGKILDVGWDGHGKPWSLDEIAAVMKTKHFKAVDHHHPEILKS
jgi:calcineurin-like phosphoesterase family protein